MSGRRREFFPRRRALKVAAAAACLLLLAFLVWGVVGQYDDGVVADAGDVPVIGYALEGLKTLGPVRFAYHWWYEGHRVVVSGRADLAALRSFGDSKGLEWGEIGPVDCSDALDGLGVEASLFRPTFGNHVSWAGNIPDVGWVEIEVRPEDGTFLLIAVR